MIYDAIQNVKLGMLPSPEKLMELQEEGFSHLINVSGIDLFQLYGEEQLSPFSINQYTFKDVFSEALQLGSGLIDYDVIDEHAYIARSTVEDRMEFYTSVSNVIEILDTQVSIFVFCHQGKGRSPCVLFTALAQRYKVDYAQILKVIKFLNAQATITCISYSAMKWFTDEFGRRSTQ